MTANFKILRIAADTYPEVTGGIGLHVHHMSKIQAEMGHDVTVLTSDHGDRSLARKEERSGYQIVRFRELADPIDNSISPGLLRGILSRQDEVDVVHAHSHLFFVTNLAAISSKFSSTPLVVTNHGLISQTAPQWLQSLYIPTVGRFTLNSADRILCYTGTDHDRLRERGVESPISVIHNGIDCSTFALSDDERERRFLFVGRLKEGKGVDILVEAFGRVATEVPDIELTIVGEGPMRGDLQELARESGVEDRVEFRGELPNDELPEIYSRSLAFVLPSHNEGLPRTVLEAMACETPVVTSNLDQLESLVNEAGWTVPVGDVDQLSSTLRHAVESPEERREKGSRGREQVLEEYSWHETVEETIEVYTELASK